MLKLILAISVGSVAGGLLRWFLSLKFNLIAFAIPLGTLLSNLIAGYIIGFAIAFFNHANLSAEWRLLVITGFCGGLSTFSTFSAEIVNFLQEGRYTLGLIMIAVHVIGSVLMTFLGILSYQFLRTC
ncbi:fluoride efflux transporter CrcB [Gilliamella sp. B2923]|uniref:fluoride efflux transporter CrcB n=1 Tax=Gilliamella sp. B2923 TaxID=2818005 RepID=UPI00226ACD5A|nr:fluoride efflux transporter CrcB [Gilliamella sp. B2923]MCX8618524.1 fluoride efflux transporter CrcB [Gilliamella sp. B2923]